MVTTKEPVVRMRLCWLAACLLLVAQCATAQSIVATNSTTPSSPGTNDTPMTISRNDDMVPLAPVLPLTDAAMDEIPPTGLSGKVVNVEPDNQLSVEKDEVALISCDDADYPGNIDQLDVFRQVVSLNVTAVVFYSRRADYCQTEGDLGPYKWVFSMKSRNDTTSVLSTYASASSPLWVTIGGPDSRNGSDGSNGSGSGSQNGDGNSNDQQQNQGPLGPNPSTAVAMIILYTITGIITALFLVIITTGAIRAHRHPERYGPRALVGRPRQSRARGIGRAILDGIPIVKFGEREESKSADVELAQTSPHQENSRETDSHAENRAAPPTDSAVAPTEDGIAAAAAGTTTPTQPTDADTQGCSICTEDFERGQDQRVLPCDHRFHPECIDPWLLNVSGTCPLCRVDLRPQTSRTSQEVDENGNPVPREGEQDELGDLPPPIAERSSVRRSLMIGILGIRGRPDRLTREERIVALRRYRDQQAARRQRGPAASGEETAHDRSIRRNLRTLLGIRTRRTGEGRQGAEERGEDGPADEGAERR